MESKAVTHREGALPKFGIRDWLIASGVSGVITALAIATAPTEVRITSIPLAIVQHVLLASTLYPTILSFQKKLKWESPFSLVGIILTISFGLPSVYHVYLNKSYINERVIKHITYVPTNGEYIWLFLNITVGVLVIYLSCKCTSNSFLTRRIPIGGIIGRGREKSYSNRYSLWAGIVIVIAGLYGTYIVNGGIQGYIAQLWQMGLRASPEEGMARYAKLSTLTIPGVLVCYVSLSRIVSSKYKRVIYSSVLFIFGIIPILNSGGRGDMVRYFLVWLFVGSIEGKNISTTRLLSFFAVLLLATTLITKMRGATSVYLRTGKTPSIERVLSVDTPKPLGLSIDKITLTTYSFYGDSQEYEFGGWLFGETYVGNFLRPLIAPLEILGFNLKYNAHPWHIVNYHGKWLIGEPNRMGIPSSMFGEDYANFGLLGVLAGSALLGVILSILHILYNRYTLSTFSPFKVVILAAVVVYVIPAVIWGGWGSISSQIIYLILPLYIFKKIVD